MSAPHHTSTSGVSFAHLSPKVLEWARTHCWMCDVPDKTDPRAPVIVCCRVGWCQPHYARHVQACQNIKQKHLGPPKDV